MRQLADLPSIAQRLGIDPSRLGAVREYVFPELGAALAAAATSEPRTVRFRTDGILLAMRGCPDTGDVADYAGLELRLQFSGQEELVTDGDFGAFLPFICMVSPFQPAFDLDMPRKVYTGQDVTVYYRNRTAGPILPTWALHLVELRG